MKRPSIGIIAATIFGALVAVDVRVASRLEVGFVSDTLVINGLQPVLLGVRAFNWHGLPIWNPHLRYSGMPAALAHATSEGTVRCKASGDATLTIAHGSVERRVLVRCRPIMSFGWGHGVSLELGGRPDSMTIEPIGYDRRPVTLLRGQAKLRTSKIAHMRDNLLFPVSIGCDFVDVEFSGGTSTRISVCVSRTAIDSSFKLVGGEIRSWRVQPGYYHVTLDVPPMKSRRVPLVLAAMNANCAQGREGPQDYYCITTDSSTLVVANRNALGSGELTGRLLVKQRPHQWANSQVVASARKE